MKFATFFHTVVSLVVVFLMASIGEVAGAKKNGRTHCNVYDLLQDCKARVVDIAKDGKETSVGDLDKYLIDECKDMKGLLAAKCLMKYLCLNHGEAAVEKVRDCIEKVCPLTRRMPKKVCSK